MLDIKVTMTKSKTISRVKAIPPAERVQLYRVTSDSKSWNGTLELIQVSQTDFQFLLNGEPRYYGMKFKWCEVLEKIESLRSRGVNLEPVRRELKTYAPAEREEILTPGAMCHALGQCSYCLRAFLPGLFERREAEAIAAKQRKAKAKTKDWRRGNKWGCKFKAVRKESSDSQNACSS